MTCPAPERLAAAAAGEDEAVAEHAAACAVCRAELDATAAVIAAVRNAPAGPALSADRHASLRAMVLASSDAAAPARGARWPWAVAVAAVVMIAVGVAATLRGGATPAAQLDEQASVAPAPRSEPRPAPSPPLAPAPAPSPPVPAPAAIDAPAVAHQAAPRPTAAHRAPPRAITALDDGATSVDTRDGAPVRVDVGGTRVEIAHASVEITAHAGVISSVRVFAGSAEISQKGAHVIVSRGELWRAPDGASAWREFEAGWDALRAERYADAIALFDRARDPAVVEDAGYWAAIAAMRAGDHDNAVKRLRAFLAAFPSSARADDVRAALARLNP